MAAFIEIIPLVAAFVVTFTSIGLLLNQDWRGNIALLAIQFIGVAALTAVSWPLEMAVTKLVAGWMAGAVLGMAIASVPSSWERKETDWPSSRLFRLFASIIVLITVVSIIPSLGQIIPQSPISSLFGGMILIGMGLLHLGLTAQPLRISTGLLTLLAGFEIIYAAVEVSTLVAGLLAGVNLGLGLIGGYMITAGEMEPERE